MSFKVVGKGLFSKDNLIELLRRWGSTDPDEVVKQAERGRATYGDLRILAVRY